MVNAQEWLDKEYPLAERSKITELDIYNKNLTGELKLLGFSDSLSFLTCGSNNLTNLDVSNCLGLIKFDCSDNNLTELDLTGCSSLIDLNCSNNNLTKLDLTVLGKFINLEKLMLGNSEKEKIKSGIYNKLSGSLEPLKNLTKLRFLCIEATDIDSGLEYLPNSLNEAKYDSDTETPKKGARVFCSPDKRPGSKV